MSLFRSQESGVRLTTTQILSASPRSRRTKSQFTSNFKLKLRLYLKLNNKKALTKPICQSFFDFYNRSSLQIAWAIAYNNATNNNRKWIH